MVQMQINRPSTSVPVTDPVITAIAMRAARSCYGVVGIGRKGPARIWPVSRMLGKGSISIAHHQELITVHIPVILEYGLPVAAVVSNLVQSVRFQLEQAIGLIGAQIDVTVTELRHQPT